MDVMRTRNKNNTFLIQFSSVYTQKYTYFEWEQIFTDIREYEVKVNWPREQEDKICVPELGNGVLRLFRTTELINSGQQYNV